MSEKVATLSQYYLPIMKIDSTHVDILGDTTNVIVSI